MNGSNSRALRMSGAAVIGLIALDLLLSAIVLGPRLNEEGAFTLLAILDMVIGGGRAAPDLLHAAPGVRRARAS